MPPSPTARSLEECRRRGWPAEKVEYYDPYSKRRFDLWGLGDIIALDGDDVVLIQATSGSNHAHRVAKLKAHQNTRKWLASSNRRLEVWSWALRGPANTRKLWTLRIEPIPRP